MINLQFTSTIIFYNKLGENRSVKAHEKKPASWNMYNINSLCPWLYLIAHNNFFFLKCISGDLSGLNECVRKADGAAQAELQCWAPRAVKCSLKDIVPSDFVRIIFVIISVCLFYHHMKVFVIDSLWSIVDGSCIPNVLFLFSRQKCKHVKSTE